MLCGVLIVLLTAAGTAAQSGGYVGRPVADVLRELQTDEFRIIFSSDLVPPTMRVKAEPGKRTARDVAEQILEAHELALKKGPRNTWIVIERPQPPARLTSPAAPTVRAPHPPAIAEPPPPLPPVRIEEQVEVVDRLRETAATGASYTVQQTEVRELAGGFDNVFQMMQVLPGAAGINDEEGKLAVRGAGPEHNLIVVDDLQIHRPQRLGHFTASFLNPATIERVSLDASGLDARFGQRLSSVTVIDTRDGARDRRLAVSGSLGLVAGDVLLEGRLPGTESGSWWVSTRGTYYRPVFARFEEGIAPGFGDVQFKVAARPSPRTRLTVFGLAGRETLRSYQQLQIDGPTVLDEEYRGENRLGVVSLSWTPTDRLIATTSVSAYANDERDYGGFFWVGIAPFERVTQVHDYAARQRFVYSPSTNHLIDGGVEVRRVRSAWRMESVKQPEFWRGLGPSTWGERIDYSAGPIDTRLTRTQAGFWLQDRIALGRRMTLEPGLRVDWNSFTGESAVQPRVRVSGRIGQTIVWTGLALQAQTPSHESLQGLDFFQITPESGASLENERSRQVVVGFERRLRPDLALRVEGYHRRFESLLVQRLENAAERTARLSAYDLPPDLPADAVVLEHRPTVHPESTGTGKASGLEVLLQREGRKVSGWITYSLSKSTRDLNGHEVPFDFDRRHAFSVAGLAQLSRRVRASLTWQMASGFPVTPLHEEVSFGQRIDLTKGLVVDPIYRAARDRSGALVTTLDPFMRRLALRNSERLSGYGRTDVRVTFATLGHWEFYGEVINLFNQRNYLIEVRFPATQNLPESVSQSNIYAEFDRIPTAGLRFRF